MKPQGKPTRQWKHHSPTNQHEQSHTCVWGNQPLFSVKILYPKYRHKHSGHSQIRQFHTLLAHTQLMPKEKDPSSCLTSGNIPPRHSWDSFQVSLCFNSQGIWFMPCRPCQPLVLLLVTFPELETFPGSTKGISYLNIFIFNCYMKMQIKTRMRYHLIPIRTAFILKSTNNKYWRGYGEKRTFLHCW